MGLRTLAGAAAMAAVLAIAAATTAQSAPLAANGIRTVAFAPVVQIGHRQHGTERYNGGIRYDGPYGLTYAPSYWRHRHSEEINVNVYIGPRVREDTRQRARPLIIDLRR